MERGRSASEQRPARPNAPRSQRGSGDDCADDARRRSRVGRSASLRRTLPAASAGASLPLPQHLLLLLLLLGVCLATVGADLASMGALPPPQPLPQLPPYFINESHVGFRCATMHACEWPGSDEYRDCSCHPSCSLFDTCCGDARPSDWRRRKIPADQYLCASPVPWRVNLYDFQPNHTLYTHNMGSLVVNKCPGSDGSDNSSNSSSYLRALCAHPLQRTGDGVLSTPVMANGSQISYRNIFCAFCHGENVSTVTPWTQVNITIPERYDYGRRGGNVRIGFRTPEGLNVSSCRLNLVTGCSDPDADSYREACENGPTAYVFDNWNIRTFRNWNCSACNGRPAVSCVFSRYIFDYWSPNGPVAIPMSSVDDNSSSSAVDVDPLCPGHLNASLSASERTFWLDRCPSLETATVDRPLCSAWLNASDLTVLYHNVSTAAGASFGGNGSAWTTVSYGVASHYAWLLVPGVEETGDAGDGRLAPVVCARCVAWQLAAPCVVPSTSGATLRGGSGDDDTNATLTIGGKTYRKPFFVKRSATCSMIICSEWDPNALAALSASGGHFGGRSAFQSVAVAIALTALARFSLK